MLPTEDPPKINICGTKLAMIFFGHSTKQNSRVSVLMRRTSALSLSTCVSPTETTSFATIGQTNFPFPNLSR
jgi:hypothetical protein